MRTGDQRGIEIAARRGAAFGPTSSALTRSSSRAVPTATSTGHSSTRSRAICSAPSASIRRWSFARPASAAPRGRYRSAFTASANRCRRRCAKCWPICRSARRSPDQDGAVHRISAEIGRYFDTGRHSGAPESIELIEPVFYRGLKAFVVGRLIGDGSITPLVVAFSNSPRGVRGRRRDAVARRGGFAVRLCALLLPRRSAGGQRRDHTAAFLHAA